MQEVLSMDPPLQSYRSKPLEGNLNTMHRSLGYPYHSLSYRNTPKKSSAPIYYLSRYSHTY